MTKTKKWQPTSSSKMQRVTTGGTQEKRFQRVQRRQANLQQLRYLSPQNRLLPQRSLKRKLRKKQRKRQRRSQRRSQKRSLKRSLTISRRTADRRSTDLN